MYSLAKNISATAAVVIIERFGQGKSTMTKRKRSIDTIILELQTVIEEIRKKFTGTVNLVGHSLGGLLVFEYAKKFQVVNKIVLIDAVPLTNKVGKLVYAANFIPAYFFILLRKTGLIKKIPTSKLLEAEVIQDASKIPNEIIDEAILEFKLMFDRL